MTGARERARREVLLEIEHEAWRQLTETGPDELSLRSVARALGMANSALYRYFPSREHLLRTLLRGADASLAEAVRAATAAAPPQARWRALAEASRAWARSHPHELALVDAALPAEAGLSAPLQLPALLAETVGPERSVVACVLLLALLRLDRLDRLDPSGPSGLPGCHGAHFAQGLAATEQLLAPAAPPAAERALPGAAPAGPCGAVPAAPPGAPAPAPAAARDRP